jgi:conjugative relaxase-like TrwC/TraI family protein
MTVDDYYSNTGGKEPPGRWHFAGTPEQREMTERTLGLVDGATFNSEDTEAFEQLCNGFNPNNGEKLVQNAGDRAGRLALHDFTLSAPKSFSVVWSQADLQTRRAIEEVQHQAAREAMELLSRKGAYSRQGKGGKVKTPVSLVVGMFDHGSSRADDPQLHTHACVLNVTIRPDGTTGSLESRDIMAWQGAAASVYHAGLAWRARQMGAQIRMEGNLPEIEGVPLEVMEAFSRRRATIEAAVEQWQAEHGLTRDASSASRGLLQQATIETRDAKDELTREQLHALWLERGQALGFTEAQVREVMALGEPVEILGDEQLLEAARHAVAQLTDTDATFTEPALYTRVAIALCGQAEPADIDRAVEMVKRELVHAQVIHQRVDAVRLASGPPTEKMVDLARRIEQQRLQYGQAAALNAVDLDSFAEVRAYLNEHAWIVSEDNPSQQVDEPEVSIVYSTKELVLAERDLQARARQLAPQHALPEADVAAAIDSRDAAIRAAVASDLAQRGEDPADAKGLEDEQRAAIRHACLGPASVSVIEGTAGAGKTFSATTIAEIYKDAGYTVHGLGSAWAQAINLQQEAQLDSGRAITGWLHEVRTSRLVLDPKSLVIVDEAGMVGARQMRDVLEVVQRAGAKAILLGDTRQQAAVSAGDALRVVVAETGSARLDIIRRQSSEAERQAVHAVFAGRAAEALPVYDKRTTIEVNREATMRRLIEDWAASRQAHPLQDDPKRHSHLILALDNATVRELNQLAHEARQAAGELGERSLQLHTMDCSEPGQVIEFSEGDEVVFRANQRSQGVFNRIRGTVESIDEASSTLHVRTEDGALVEVDPSAERWQHRNGGLALQHGYASTYNASQGLTRGRVFMVDHVGLDRRSAGVGLSRHREDCRIYVDREARYLEKMKRVDATEWHHINSFSDAECLGRVAGGWSRESDKASTLDHEQWLDDAGDRFLVAEELAIDRAARQLEQQDLRPRPELLGFQRAAAYELELPPAGGMAEHRSRQQLVAAGISPQVVMDAERAGFLAHQPDEDGSQGSSQGEPIYLGRDSCDRVLNTQQDDGKPAPGPLRDRFAPVLPGTDHSRVVVAPTGRDALAAWTLADQAGQPRPTVVVATREAQLQQRAQVLSQAKRIEVMRSPASERLASRVRQVAPEAAVEREAGETARQRLEAAAAAERAHQAAEEARRQREQGRER